MIQNLLGLILFIITFPITFLASILIIIIDKQNPIFIQERVGLNKNLFKMIKLSTFKNNQITNLGYYLRKYYIDELPQFLNVLIGNMALIGPRPLLKSDYKDEKFYARTSVLPGCAGYQQIHGRIDNIEDKMSYDMYYIKNKSMWLDFTIIIKTIFVILKGTGK